MFKKTLSAIMAVSLLSSFALFSNDMGDEILRGHKKQQQCNTCVNGNISFSVSQLALNCNPVNVSATGSGFKVVSQSCPELVDPAPPSCTTTVYVTNDTPCIAAVGTVNGCSYVYELYLPITLTFKCPFKCTPAVLTSFETTSNFSLVSSSTAPCAVVLNQAITTQNASKCSVEIVLHVLIAGTDTGSILSFATNYINNVSIDFQAVNCSCCCNQNNCQLSKQK